jgi:predicted nucleic acid-binding protein
VTRYLLDTDTLIDISHRIEPTRSRVRSLMARGEQVGVCAVNIAEFMAGVPPHERVLWATFFGRIRHWQIPRAAALHAGYDRYDLGRRGQQVSATDALVAATARYWNATIVTGNVRHFPMADIAVVSFRT